MKGHKKKEEEESECLVERIGEKKTAKREGERIHHISPPMIYFPL